MAIRVFIADDHAIVREGLTTLLSAAPGITVSGSATNGRDAVKKVLAERPEVVILDISMPELDGIEAARQILAEAPRIGIIMLSMHSNAEHVFHSLSAGVRGYLLKETCGSDITEAVRAVASGRRYLSGRVAEIVAEGLGEGDGPSPLESLSKREREILKLVADGHSSAKIAEMLFLSPKSIDSYRSRLMQKLHLGDMVGLIKFAIRHGLTSLD